ncbi:MAG: glycoside hydrolase family 16 protein, partial [Phycisphaerae bacterium]|nr:glycoside hydrolase family 16 protein [Phycisphaerae bacterium]
MKERRTIRILTALAAIVFVLAIGPQAMGGPWDTVLFRDDFAGPEISGDDWVINNPNSNWWQPLGRTFFPNPTTHIGDPFPHVENDACVIEFHKYNHRHLGTPKTTFLSGEIHTVQQFAPDKDYRFEARVKSNASPGGLVTSFFLYGYDGAEADEIDFEFLSNKINDNATYPIGDPVLTNTWDESLELPQYFTKDGMDL